MQVACWRSQYGFDMSRVIPLATAEFLERPKYDHVFSVDEILSAPVELAYLDMQTVTVDDLERLSTDVCFHMAHPSTVHGLGSWFDVDFGGLPNVSETVRLSTAPGAPTTHWKQDLLMFDTPIECAPGDVLRGTITLVRHPELRRHLRVKAELTQERQSQSVSTVAKEFLVWQ